MPLMPPPARPYIIAATPATEAPVNVLQQVCYQLKTPKDRTMPFMPPPARPSIIAATPATEDPVDELQQQESPISTATVKQDVEPCLESLASFNTADSAYNTLSSVSTRSGNNASQHGSGAKSTVSSNKNKSSSSSTSIISGKTSVMTSSSGVVSNGSSNGINLPKLTMTSTSNGSNKRGSKSTRGSRVGSSASVRGESSLLGGDKLARIGELIFHEEVAQETAQALQQSPNRDSHNPPSDFVLQEADAVLKTHEDLRNFWRKYHHVQLERLSMRREAETLRQEEKSLRSQLRDYLTSLGLTDEALAQSQAPVSVSHIALKMEPPRRRAQSCPPRHLAPPGGLPGEGRIGSANNSALGSISQYSSTSTPHSRRLSSLSRRTSGSMSGSLYKQPQLHIVQEANFIVHANSLHSTRPRINIQRLRT